MTMIQLDGVSFIQMIQSGAYALKKNLKKIDALNVFPVPDGDTGTNMNLSMESGLEEIKNVSAQDVSKVAAAFSKGLLMGARGNSGVILSQLFRGFSQALEGKQTATIKDFAFALENGVNTAYKAVMKPVEGTILTVAKDAANQAIQLAKREEDLIVLMEKVLYEAKRSLQRTPELLPVLKEAGVVDSGGQGLVTIYEGFLAALKGEALPEEPASMVQMEAMVKAKHHKTNQHIIDPTEIKYGYCTEFMIKFEQEKIAHSPFNEEQFRHTLSEHGDSLLVVADEELAKVHIHTEYPGQVMNIAQEYGSLINIDIDNMREQHTAFLQEQTYERPKEDYAIITVSMGSGIKELFESLGASIVIEGGQTMNPSTKDINEAIERANAHHVLILPNNKNIIMAAEQAAKMAQDKVSVVPTTTIPQGITAMLAFHPEASLKENESEMTLAIDDVKTGQVTYAVRDTEINGLKIKKGHFMGIADGEIKTADKNREENAKQLLEKLIDKEVEIVTILYGQDVKEEQANQLSKHIEHLNEDVEVEVYHGNQPIYSYIFAVE